MRNYVEALDGELEREAERRLKESMLHQGRS